VRQEEGVTEGHEGALGITDLLTFMIMVMASQM
jgi:hypothetical protein